MNIVRQLGIALFEGFLFGSGFTIIIGVILQNKEVILMGAASAHIFLGVLILVEPKWRVNIFKWK